jgi:hypothetical protein
MVKELFKRSYCELKQNTEKTADDSRSESNNTMMLVLEVSTFIRIMFLHALLELKNQEMQDPD